MKSLFIISIFTLALGACAIGKAAGTNPSEMSASEHRAAGAREQAIADAYRKRASDLHGGKGTYSAEAAADEHEAFAKQHVSAGAQVEASNRK